VETLSVQVSGRSIASSDEQLHRRLAVWLSEHTAGFARRSVRFQMLDLNNTQTPQSTSTAEAAHQTVNLVLGYDGRSEIAAATRAMMRERTKACRLEARATNAAEFRKHLPSAHLPPVDLLIHAGGQTRLSGFLLWQSAYAELLFIETRWRSFDRAQLTAALNDYAQRKRTFGGLA
jgi:undecaprenyl diphosphate synthase